MAIKNLSTIVEEYGKDDNPVNISFGLRPSGTIHLGNLMSLSLAVGLGRKIGPHVSKLNITLCDLDLPNAKDWSRHREGYVKHYKNLPDEKGCHDTICDHVNDRLEDFLGILNEKVPIEYDITPLSEVQRDPDFRKGLKRVLDSETSMSLILPNIRDESVLVYPLCPQCEGSYAGDHKGKYNTYKNGIIHTYCTNGDCSVEEFEIDVLDLEKDLAVHLFIDPLRDALVKPYADIHVFGGDYSMAHGQNHLPKAQKINEIVGIASNGKRLPDFLIGPTIYGKDGSKMSKSFDNGLNSERLRAHLKSDYPERVLKFTMDVMERGYKNIDYAQISEELLGVK